MRPAKTATTVNATGSPARRSSKNRRNMLRRKEGLLITGAVWAALSIGLGKDCRTRPGELQGGGIFTGEEDFVNQARNRKARNRKRAFSARVRGHQYLGIAGREDARL